MITPLSILTTLPEEVNALFRYWVRYMENCLTFSLPQSEIHTQRHSERVLLYALLLGRQILGRTEEPLETLAHAAIFHDTRRQDDWLDVGHGARASSYYRQFGETNGNMTFHPSAFLIIKYHDRDDAVGKEAIARSYPHDSQIAIRLYEIFKDADALDRFRLGEDALDERFLRNQESVQLIEFAKNLVNETR